MDDLRLWFVFRLPESAAQAPAGSQPSVAQSIAHVPAVTEEEARAILRRNCYKDAPVDSWIASKFPLIATRQQIVRHLMLGLGGLGV